MSLIGYTPGGSPIFFGGSRAQTQIHNRKNARFKCSYPETCNAKTTRNQLRKNGNICHQCRKPLKHRNAL